MCVFLVSLVAGNSPILGLGSNIATAGPTLIKSDKHAKSHVVPIKRKRRRRVRIRLPRGPSYIYYDYPYYYSRGFYPKHIGGYVYYPNIPIYYPRHRERCADFRRRCKANWKKKKRSRLRNRKRRHCKCR